MHDPLDVIAECLGEPAGSMRNPANADYRCPFSNARCTKPSHGSSLPFPVCSIYRRRASAYASRPVCVCPVRFYGADIVGDVLRSCWTGPPPENPVVAHEVQMQKFGKVDMVIANLTASGSVDKFIPIELQAVDITGTYLPAYEALLQSRMYNEQKAYGFNWANVRKRFMSQMVAKGYYCHHWQTRIVGILQEDLFEQFTRHAQLPEVALADSTIVFLLYQFERADSSLPWTLVLKRTVPTRHESVVSSILYELPPSRSLFERRILDRLAD